MYTIHNNFNFATLQLVFSARDTTSLTKKYNHTNHHKDVPQANEYSEVPQTEKKFSDLITNTRFYSEVIFSTPFPIKWQIINTEYTNFKQTIIFDDNLIPN